MIIRYVVVKSEDAAKQLLEVAASFGLAASMQMTGCDDCHAVLVSEHKLPHKLRDELFDYDPVSHDWSDSKHDIKVIN